MLTFLHLSDLHITTSDANTQFDREAKMRDALLADLGKDGRAVFDAILVTGDIAFSGRTDEFKRAKAWLEQLRTATSTAPEALFVVPGNHDVNRTLVPKDSSLWELHQSLRKDMPYETRLASLHKKLNDPFNFLTALAEYGAFAAEYGCPTEPKALAWVQVLDDDRQLEDGSSVRFHGLNSALISDGEDKRANLLLGEAQFCHFDNKPNYVNVVLCHHPYSWLIDGNRANDFFRAQAHAVLCGHDHDLRCYNEGGSLRVYAGALHPDREEANWQPCYHVLRLSVATNPTRELITTVETRVWQDKDKCFAHHQQPDGTIRHEERIKLPPWTRPAALVLASPRTASTLSSPENVKLMTATLTSDAFAAARRKLIVHFFRLGTLARYKAVLDAGVWDETDDALEGQARWARVFERAEKAGKLPILWDAVAAEDKTLAGQANPFTT